MDVTLIALNKILIMFIMIVIGVICSKTGVIDEVGNKKITNLILMLVNALVIFMSYQVEFKTELMWGLLFTMGISVLSFSVSIIITNIVISKKNKDHDVERLSIIYSNCGFIGIPLISGIIGDEGVFYLAMYLTVFNVLLWTHGYIQMNGKCSFNDFKKVLLSPCLVAVFLGVISFVLQLKLPRPMAEAFSTVASMNTPLAMLCAGATIAMSKSFSVLKRIRTYWICFLKLFVIPLLTFVLVLWLPIDNVIKAVVLIAASCPTGASCTQFAIKFGKNSEYASELFAITTVLCIISIPAVIMLACPIMP